MSWITWAILLLLQNASFTWVSRARNSGSIKYHAVAAIGSNGIWFLNQIVVINKITDAFKAHDTLQMLSAGLFYTVFTVLGSVGMHHFLMTRVEQGKRKVGAHG